MRVKLIVEVEVDEGRLAASWQDLARENGLDDDALYTVVNGVFEAVVASARPPVDWGCEVIDWQGEEAQS